jgi:hypothetical protein
VAAAMTLMRTLSEIGHALAKMPAVDGHNGHAGLSFSVPRICSGPRHEGVGSAIEEAAKQVSARR